MKAFFIELFEYSHLLNQKWADQFIESQAKAPVNSVKLFSHILNAHRVWNNRLHAEQPGFNSWEIHPIQEFKEIDKINFEHSLHIVQEYTLNDIVQYKNFQGQPFSNSVRDILFHVVNHSTHHRAQIATDFRQNGMEPLVMDYIFYKR